MNIVSELSPELDVCIIRIEHDAIAPYHLRDLMNAIGHHMQQASRVVVDLSDVHSMCSSAVVALLEVLGDTCTAGHGLRHALVAPPASVKRLLALLAVPGAAPVYDFTEHALNDMRLATLAANRASMETKRPALALL